MALENRNKVEKRNDLNEVRSKRMTVQQLRLFAIYLSRINARDESTRRVRFSLSDFQKIMELSQIKMKNLKAATDNLLCKIVSVPNENGGYISFQLFKECTVDKDEYGEWFVELDAHDKALPLFFDFKEKYFTYEVGNVLRLASVNQMRMYEILKQRQKLKQPAIIQLQDLRELLGVDESAYPRFGNFRVFVLDKAQKELDAQTDITFTYQLIKRGRKVAAISFNIQKNEKSTPQLCIEEYLNSLPDPAGLDETAPAEDEGTAPASDLFADALPANLSAAEVEALRGLAVDKVDTSNGRADAELKIYDYLSEKTRLLYAQKKPVKPENYFAWLRKAVDGDWT
jgi:hypothetical protein